MRNFLVSFLLLTLVCCLPSAAPALDLPPPDNAFFTLTDFFPDCRLAAFDGNTVWEQPALGADFVALGTMPTSGIADPAFTKISDDGATLALGAGFGGYSGSNGGIYTLSSAGGTATLAGTVPYHSQAAFLSADEMIVSAGTATFVEATLEYIDLSSGLVFTVVDGIPGAAGGVAVAANGDLYTGIGFGNDLARTGEIKRFDAAAVDAVLLGGAALDYEVDGIAVGQVLSAGAMDFDSDGKLLVGGGDLFGSTGSYGFYVVIDPITGDQLFAADPSDGDPDNGSFVSYTLSHCPALGVTFAADSNQFFAPGTPSGSAELTSSPAIGAELRLRSIINSEFPGLSPIFLDFGSDLSLADQIDPDSLSLLVDGVTVPVTFSRVIGSNWYLTAINSDFQAAMGSTILKRSTIVVQAGDLPLAGSSAYIFQNTTWWQPGTITRRSIR